MSEVIGNKSGWTADQTIQSQYSSSPILTGIIAGMERLVSPQADIQLFFDMIFNVATAQGMGLDWWGRIVGVNRQMNVPSLNNVFGFDGSSLAPWNEGIFYTKENAIGVYDMSDDAFRELILWKALANIATADIATLNVLLQKLFPGKIIFALETDVMQIRITSASELEPYQRSILRTYGIFMKAAGVGYEWLEVPDIFLGFVRSFELAPFGQAPFYNGGVQQDEAVNEV